MHDTLRSRIKEATRQVHDLIDSHAVSATVLSPAVTVADYARFLGVTYGFLQPLERSLVESGLAGFVPRSPAILDDLRAVGVTEESLAAIPLARGVEPVGSEGEAMGLAYVIEGSRMGGLVIAKHIGRHLGLSSENGLSFFLPSHPHEIVARFHQFVAKLDSFAKCSCEEREAMDGAQGAFRLVKFWLDNAPRWEPVFA